MQPIRISCRTLLWFSAFARVLGAQAPCTTDTDKLRVEHDFKSPVTVSAGDTLPIRITLVNTGDRPIEISWGQNLLLLEARRYTHLVVGAPVAFPSRASWGEVGHLEFPNPNAVYLSDITTTILAARESKSAQYRVPFQSKGTYSVKACADLIGRGRICDQREIAVTVR